MEASANFHRTIRLTFLLASLKWGCYRCSSSARRWMECRRTDAVHWPVPERSAPDRKSVDRCRCAGFGVERIWTRPSRDRPVSGKDLQTTRFSHRNEPTIVSSVRWNRFTTELGIFWGHPGKSRHAGVESQRLLDAALQVFQIGQILACARSIRMAEDRGKLQPHSFLVIFFPRNCVFDCSRSQTLLFYLSNGFPRNIQGRLYAMDIIKYAE